LLKDLRLTAAIGDDGHQHHSASAGRS
jgi:hypothetical protein